MAGFEVTTEVLSMMVLLLGDLLNDGVHPSGSGFGIRQNSWTERCWQPRPDLGNDFRRYTLLPERLERLDDQSAFPEFESSLFQSSVFESQGGVTDFEAFVGSIGQIDGACWNLSREPQQIQCCCATRLDSPAKLTRQSAGNLVDVRAQLLLQEFAVSRVVIDSADNPSHLTFGGEAMQSGIDRGSLAKVQKIARRERPTTPCASNAIKYPIFR